MDKDCTAAGVLRISINSSVHDSEAEDSISVSSFSSAASSTNPAKENGGFSRSPYTNKYGGRTRTLDKVGKAYVGDTDQSTPPSTSPQGDINRSISMSNLSLTERSPSAAGEIRTITNNYQTLLKKATKEIRKLTMDKVGLEKEMEKLLKANVELATEIKKLLEEQKEWRGERRGLMDANKEFVTEVERLYSLEEKWEEERSRLLTENKSKEDDIHTQSNQWKEEKLKLEDKVDQLLETVKLLTLDNDKLIQERENNLLQSSKSNQELKADYEEKIMKLEATVSNLHAQLENDSEEREKLEQEIENIANELEKKAAVDNSRKGRIDQLVGRTETLSAQLFEAQMAKDSAHNELEDLRMKDKKYRLEIDQLKVEKEWLVSRGKDSKSSGSQDEMEKLKDELRAEKEKVANLTTWKGQLVTKNKELQLENERLLSRAEDLEALMNDEVTDINELLNVINNIQGSNGNLVDPSLLKRQMFK